MSNANTDSDPIYWVTAVDGRSNVREYEVADEPHSREAAYALRSRIQHEHPNWIVRVKVM